MLKKSCPYHKGSVNHTLEQCEMLRKYYNRVTHRDEDKKKDAGDKGGEDESPTVENAFFIFGGPTANMTSRQRKQERREVFSVTKATLSYLDWSEDTISFGREDHPDYVPHPGRYPLIVNPIIGNTRFSKVVMDRGSSLNIMYARTLELMGIGLNQLRPSNCRSMVLRRGSESNSSARSIYPSASAQQPTFARKCLPSRWWGFGEPTTPFLVVRAMPSSWLSPTTPTSS